MNEPWNERINECVLLCIVLCCVFVIVSILTVTEWWYIRFYCCKDHIRWQPAYRAYRECKEQWVSSVSKWNTWWQVTNQK